MTENLTAFSLVPDLLLNPDKALITFRQQMLEHSQAFSKLCKEHIFELNELDCYYSDKKKEQELKTSNLVEEMNNIKEMVYSKENEMDLLRHQIHIVNSVSKKATSEAPNEDELSDIINKVCHLRVGIEKEKKLIKQELAQYQKGILYYKTYLLCNVIHEPKDTLIFTTNLSAQSSSDLSEYIKFTTQDKGNSFQCMEMQLKLKTDPDLLKRYQESNDIQGLILYFFKALKSFKTRNILAAKN